MLYIITKQIDRTHYLQIVKSLLCRKSSQRKRQSRIEKLCVFILYLFYPFYVIFHLKKTTKNDFAVEMSSENDSTNIFSRSLFVSHYFYDEDDISRVQYLSGSEVYYHRFKWKGIKEATTIWLLFLGCAWLAVFKKRATLLKAYFRMMNVLSTASFTDNHISSFYIFRLSTTLPYYLSLYLSQYMKRHVFTITGSTYMYTKRYSYLPNCIMCLCAEYQKIEIDNYIKNGWMSCKSVQMTGFEEYDLIKDIKVVKPKYDIGIYSSGWWARSGGLRQVTDIEGIKEMKYSNNHFYMSFLSILDEIAPYCRENNLNVIVYPHPYERRLKSKYSIECPYMELLSKYGFDFDDDGAKSSIAKIYDCNVGIGIGSTIVAQRWSLGLKAVSLFDDHISKIVNLNYIGRYKNYFFNKPADVPSIIDSLIKEDSL